MGNWAERQGLAYTSYTDLAAQPQVYNLIQGEIARVNASLAQEPQMAGARIKRFLILHKELDPDDGELTRTRKVRRRFVGEKYADLIEALYSDEDRVTVETQVVFEDGRMACSKLICDPPCRAEAPRSLSKCLISRYRGTARRPIPLDTS